jgi:hypothetical protein
MVALACPVVAVRHRGRSPEVSPRTSPAFGSLLAAVIGSRASLVAMMGAATGDAAAPSRYGRIIALVGGVANLPMAVSLGLLRRDAPGRRAPPGYDENRGKKALISSERSVRGAGCGRGRRVCWS